MSTRHLAIVHKVLGVPTDYDFVRFGTYGVRRVDTLESVAGTENDDWSHDEIGVYYYDVTVSAGVTYEYQLLRKYEGETRSTTKTFIATQSSPACVYATLEDLQNVYGIKNVQEWSTLEPDDVQLDETRVQASFDYAQSEIDVALSVRYTTPMAALTGAGAEIVKAIACHLAGPWLYHARGMNDEDPKGDRLRLHREEALGRLKSISLGLLDLDGAELVYPKQPTSPFIV